MVKIYPDYNIQVLVNLYMYYDLKEFEYATNYEIEYNEITCLIVLN